VWDLYLRIVTSELVNAPAWKMSLEGGATSAERVTGTSPRVRDAGIVAAIRMDPGDMSAILGRVSATARSGLEVSTATSARRASLASAPKVASDARHAGQRVRCAIRTMAAASAPSSPVVWDVDNVFRAPGAGRLAGVAGNASAITLAPLVSSVPPAMDSASVVRVMRAGTATPAPWVTLAIRSAGDVAAIQKARSPNRMVPLPVTQMVSARASL